MKALFAAGGTAGHINPALAAAGALKERVQDCEILFIGTADKMESRLVPAAGYAFRSIDIAGFWRAFDVGSIKHNISTASKLLKASRDASRIIKEFSPDVVVGFGGYVSGPVLREAVKLKIPTLIHEQNALPGVTNKMLAKKVDTVMVSSPAALERISTNGNGIVTGLPVRGELLAADREKCRESFNLSDDRIIVLSMGGSLGADAINNAMVGLISDLIDDKRFFFIHSTGSSGKWVREKLEKKGIDTEKAENLDLREYIDDMEVCMPAADIVICRAGASSISELEALGKPSILIPSPTVAENHQYYNALALAEAGAAKLIEEKDLTPEGLKEVFLSMTESREKLDSFGKNARALSISDARDKIVDCIMEVSA